MELRHYLALLRRRRLLIIVTIVAGLAAGYGITPRRALYQANVTIYVGTKSLPLGTGQLAGEALGLEETAATFAAMIPSVPIATRAIRDTGIRATPNRLVAETKAFQVSNTHLIYVTTTDPNPATAQLIANGMAEAFVEEIQTFEPVTPSANGAPPVQPAYVFQSAQLPTTPQARRLSRNLILSGLLALVASIAVVLLLDYLDVSVKAPSELERRIGLPVLGVIPAQRQISRILTPGTRRGMVAPTAGSIG